MLALFHRKVYALGMIIDEEDLISILKSSGAGAGSISAWAAKKGIAVSYVAEILRGMRRPSKRLAALLGYERLVGYQKRDK